MPTNSLVTASAGPQNSRFFRTRGSASQPTSFIKKLIPAVIIAAVAAAVPVIAEKIMDQLGSEEIAKALVGNWIGQVSEPDGKTKSYSMSMSLRGGAPGEVVGSSYFSAEGSWSCGNSLTLKKGGINPLILEHPDSGDAKPATTMSFGCPCPTTEPAVVSSSRTARAMPA